MAPVIHLVRHAQGYHNLSVENQWIRDPDLTDVGKIQCELLCRSFPSHDKITHLVASPIRRTVFTCRLSFAPVVNAGKKIVALPDAQELSLYPCDIGSDLELLKEEFGDLVDFRLVGDDWNQKTPESKYYPEPAKLEARARDVRLWLRDLVKEAGEDAQVVLVTHGGILHYITEDWSGLAPGRGTAWENTEYRSYEFADKTGRDPNASLAELPESRRERPGLAEIPLTQAKSLAIRTVFEAGMIRDVQECVEKLGHRQARGNGVNGTK